MITNNYPISSYNRVSVFINNSLVVWGHKLAQDFKNIDNITKLKSEWKKATCHFSDYQFKTAVRQCREYLVQFPSIAEFLKFIPQHTEELNSKPNQEEAENIKQQIKNLDQKRTEILLQVNSIKYNQDLFQQEKKDRFSQIYTLTRAIDEQLGNLERKSL